MSSPTATLAQSSGGGGYSGGGYHSGGWYVDHYEADGHRVYKLYANSPQPTDSLWATGPLVSSSGLGFPVQGVPASTSGSVTAVLVWGGDPQQVPNKVYARVSSNASSSVASNNQGLIPPDPSNGFGDPITGTGNKSTSGVHLVQKDNSGLATTVRLDPVSLSASTPNGNANVFISVAPDTRGVTISCPEVDTGPDGGSKYREPALTGPVITNQREANGTLRGDTALYRVPQDNGDRFISFTGNAVGSWSVGSDYHWYSSLSGYSYSGVWPNINSFETSDLGANIGQADHIFLSLCDAGPDKAEASANYYLHLHEELESSGWPDDPGSPYKVPITPDPDASVFAAAGSPMKYYPWKAERDPTDGTKYAPAVIGPASSNSGYTYGSEKGWTGSVGGALGVGKDKVNAQFGGNYDWSQARSDSLTIGVPHDLNPGQMTWGVWREDVQRHKGHLDHYGVHGYIGTGIWYRDDTVSIDHQFYFPYQSAGTTSPHDPESGWNPPGY